MTIPEKLEFTITFPGDEGFLGRECNSGECGRYFKMGMDSLKPEMHCPYCGLRFSNDELWTEDQLDYARDRAAHEVLPLIQEEVQEMFRKAFKGKRGWTYKRGPVPKRGPEPAPPSEKRVDSELVCPECDTRFQVDGIFGYCPGCRAENLRLYDANLRVIEQEIERSENPQRALRHAYADLVSTFEVFARREAEKNEIEKGRFQNLTHTRRLFRQAMGVDVFEHLETHEIRVLKRVFEKRHVHEHNEGIVSERYVREIPEDRDLLGEIAPLSVDELKLGASLLRRVLEVLIERRFKGPDGA